MNGLFAIDPMTPGRESTWAMHSRELGREMNVELKAGQVEEWVDLWEERGVNALKGKRQGKRKGRSVRSPESGPA